ncbi:coiled-coil domain-containing protein 60-like [Alosa sapidissima]|uniref:coiled-coil domain-containing protein 60-like n=1 Tax=Alosa sapidissima TaxID=34773 RepID=UPI001C0A0395|nr:coiled-coil domain-containing protein 60-like [Alosa sapidissima]
MDDGAVSRDINFDPREFVTIKPLPSTRPSGEKLQARSKTVYVTCHDKQVFWENYRRRQRQLNRQGYWAAPWRSYEEVGEPLYLEPKKLILSSLGQLDEALQETPVSSKTGPVSSSANLVSTHALMSSSFHVPQTRSREDIVNLKQHLAQTRRLLRAVRQGRGYFQLLEKEAQEAKGQETQGAPGPQPPGLSSDSDTDSESPVSSGLSWPQSQTSSRGRCRTQSARPFTPIHRSLMAPQLHQVPPESVFRQLCCLNWLLEALTLGRMGRAAPVSSCWDPKDPGESKAAIKALTKEKAIQAKWEQFISVPKTPCRLPSRPSRASSGCSYLQKAPSQSRASSSLAITPTLGSLTCLAPGADGAGGFAVTSEETDQQSVAGSDAEPPVSEYLQKLLEEVYQSVAKDLYGPGTKTVGDFVWKSKLKSASANNITSGRQDPTVGFKRETPRPKSCPAGQLSATTRFINRKSSRLDELRTSFEERAEELAQTFSDCLEAKSKLLVLLRNLAAAAERNRKLARVLEKLQRFADERRLRVRPQVFLKVLGTLQPWELCLPDLCVAIEVVREHAVKMSREDYDAWLLRRTWAPGGQEHS